MRYIFLFSFLTILNVESSSIIELNNFFSGDLTFTQTSLNKRENSIDESEGIFLRQDDNSIVIEIISPFEEKYFITEDYIEIHDLEFDQITKISKEEYENNIFISYLLNGFNDLNISIKNNSKSFLISDDKNSYNFEFLNKKTLQVKFKDNMDVINLIKFYK